MLKRLRHHLVLALFLLLPFHALFVTVGTKVLMGPGHPPLVYLAIWKELLIAALFVIGIAELAQGSRFQVSGFKEVLRGRARIQWIVDWQTIFVLGLLVLGIVVSATHYSLLTTHFLFGFKYLFLPLIFFLLLKNLDWEKDFLERQIFPGLLLVSGIVAAYGILSYFLPQHFFSLLGYSDAHSLYSPTAPLSAFQLIADSGIRRIQSTFAGPNQLGMWLLIPWSLFLVSLLRQKNQELRIRNQENLHSYFLLPHSLLRFVYFLSITCAIFLTFSRAAWIAAFAITIVALAFTLRGPMRETILITFITATCVALFGLAYVSPQLFLRGISNQHHLERVRSGITAIFEHPLGQGLGSAGPASNRLRDACVYFPDGADTSWARERRDLCIFVGNAQVQPPLLERTCQCAFLPENWYLQVGVELGVLGFILFVTLIASVLRALSQFPIPNSQFPILLAFLGISIAALFLHAWEDSAVAYTVWGIVGIALGSKGIKE